MDTHPNSLVRGDGYALVSMQGSRKITMSIAEIRNKLANARCGGHKAVRCEVYISDVEALLAAIDELSEEIEQLNREQEWQVAR